MTRQLTLSLMLLFGVGGEGRAQGVPVAEFQAWGRAHASPLTFDEKTLGEANIDEFAPLKASVGSARVIAIGEPFHGAHEPLVARNRLIRYCVTKLGCTAVALETGFSNSKRLYDYVLGRAAESDSVLRSAFSYGFGALHENLDLLHWLHDYNAGRPAEGKIRLYGVDVTGALFDPMAYRSLQGVLSYLSRTDSALARQASQDLATALPVFRSDTFPLLAPEEQDRIAGKVVDLTALLRRHRLDLISAGSADDYEWAARQAYGAGLDLACMRAITPAVLRHLKANDWDSLPAAPPHFLDPTELREASMADNVAWILAREGPRGRVLLFAHDGHLQGHPVESPADHGIQSFFKGYRPMGMFLRSMLGKDLVTIGSYFGSGEGFRRPIAVNTDGVEGLLSSLNRSYILDLRHEQLPASVVQWLHTVRSTNEGGARSLRAADTYDVLLYIDRVTPARTRG